LRKGNISTTYKKINTLLDTAKPLDGAIKKLETQLDKKVNKANKAKQLEDTTALRSKLQLDCHRTSGKGFIKTMKDWFNYSNWKSIKSTKDNRNIGPQTEAILLVLFDIPCFFSRTELKVFLGYKSPNHNIEGALSKMVETKMLIIATNKVGTEVYYLGNFSRQSIARYNLPNVDSRPEQYQVSIDI
jgi:hypothetical protein